MKVARLAAVGVVLLLAVGQLVMAEGWSLNPFASQQTTKSSSKSKPTSRYSSKSTKQPSPLQKLGDGTKRFFTQTTSALMPKKPAPKKTVNPLHTSWDTKPQQPPKKSLFASMFQRQEPKRVESMKDWVGLPRPEP